MIIALEEHFIDPEVPGRAGTPPPLAARLLDFGAGRLADMDAAGIDIQVLSHAPPGLQAVAAGEAAGLARRVNDRLAAVVAGNPRRFAGFASLPTAEPEAAADELERAVRDLGFKGGIVHGLTQGKFLDERPFWPILARAETLDVPIYVHPGPPHQAVVDAYYRDYAQSHPMLLTAAWGFTVETGTQAIRLVLSGVFDQHPRLKIVLGHLGETIPFLMARVDEALSRNTPMKNFREVFSSHFHITTSGFFSDPALLCCVQEMGVDRIMFSVDWPFAPNAPGVQWMKAAPLCAEDKEKIFSGNAKRLLKL